MNSTWSYSSFMYDMISFFLLVVLTLIVELGVFAVYRITIKKPVLDSCILVVIGNMLSFLVGLMFLVMGAY